jgi:hypothetical protein
MTNEQINGVMKIAKDELYSGVFNNGVYFTGSSPVPQWTTYKPLLNYISKTIAQIVPDSTPP